MIVKEHGEYCVYCEDKKKKLGGPYKTEEQAKKRLAEIEYFKHANQRNK